MKYILSHRTIRRNHGLPLTATDRENAGHAAKGRTIPWPYHLTAWFDHKGKRDDAGYAPAQHRNTIELGKKKDPDDAGSVRWLLKLRLLATPERESDQAKANQCQTAGLWNLQRKETANLTTTK